MSTLTRYALKSLYEEIDLIDRKLAHLHKFETFPTEKARDAAAAKITVKRDKLVRAAQQITEAGVPVVEADLPRSLRTPMVPVAVEA